MFTCSFSREELVYRLAYEDFVGCSDTVASVWLSYLLEDLETAGTSVPKLSKSLCDAATLLKPDEVDTLTDQMSWELARVVVPARVLYNSGETWYIKLTDDHQVLQPDLGSPGFPYALLGDYDTSLFCRGHSIRLFFLPAELKAERLEVATKGASRQHRLLVKTWESSDSVVDWVIEFAKSQGRSARPSIRCLGTGDAVEWHFYLPSKDTFLDRFSPKENILRFIQQQGEVSTEQLLYINYCGRSRTFSILKQLVREDRIEKKAHGRYAYIVDIP